MKETTVKNLAIMVLIFVTAFSVTFTACSRAPEEGTVAGRNEQLGFGDVAYRELKPFDTNQIPAVYWVVLKRDDGSFVNVPLGPENKHVWDGLKDGQRWRSP